MRKSRAETDGRSTSESDLFVRETIKRLRLKLLDLTTRNPLLSFKHAARSKRHIRVIDELPDHLYERLESESSLRFKSLGNEETEPEDERSVHFRRALDAAKREDTDYRKKLQELGDDPGEKLLERLEQELRERVRERLGMPPRKSPGGATAADVARRRGLDPSFDLPLVPAGSTTGGEPPRTKHVDSAIQTLLFEDAMELTLARMRDQVRLSIDETGVNPLFCVFGFLEWYEDEKSEVPLHAPLLLYPLEFADRKLVRGHYQYSVRASGEGALANVALAERLKQDFEIILPPFGDDETPDKYFAQIHKVIERHRAWKVRRWVTAGLFSFARIAMYQDLDPDRWAGQGGLEKHQGLSRLLAGGTARGQTDSPSMDSVDDYKAEFDIPLIADADSSQVRAINDVRAGRDLVIEGPPGTGKSQTITNIIAVALAAGKTVLFLAEKMAALNVVKDRLVYAKLGDFCLELHSTKAGRKETFAALGRRLDLKPARRVNAKLEAALTQLEKERKHLQACVTALAQPAGNLGITTQELLWRTHRVRIETAALAGDLDELSFPQAENLTDAEHGRILASAKQLEDARPRLLQGSSSLRDHPWYGVARHDLDPFRADDVVRCMRRVADAAARAEKASFAIRALTTTPINRISDLSAISAVAAIPQPDSQAEDDVVARMADAQTLAALEEFVAEIGEYALLDRKIHDAFLDTAGPEHCTADLLRSLAEMSKNAGFGDAAVSEIDGLVERRRREAEAWEGVARLLAQVAQVAQWERVLTADAEWALVVAIELAANGKSDIASVRAPSLVVPGASDTLRRGIERAQVLRERRAELGTKYVIDSIGDCKSLREHAAALRGAARGPLAFFSPRWWRANSAYKALCKLQLRENRGIKAAAVDALSALKEDLLAFASDDDVICFVGSGFRGAESDLTPYLRVAEWADRVRSCLPPFDEVSSHLRRFLFEATAEQVEALAAMATHAHFPNLKKVIPDHGPGRCGGRTVQSQVESALERAKLAQEAKETAERFRFRSDWRVSACGSLATDLARMLELRQYLDNSATAKAVLGDRFRGHLTDTSVLVASSRYVRAVITTGLPMQLKHWLLESQALTRLADLQPLAEEAGRAVTNLESTFEQLRSLVPVDFDVWLGETSFLPVSPIDLRDRAARCGNDPEGLQDLIDDLRLIAECREERLGQILELIEARDSKLCGFAKAAERVILQSITRAAIAQCPALVNFTGLKHEGHREQFRELDRNLQRLRQAQIASELAGRDVESGTDQGPKNGWTGKALIQNEVAKQKRHVPIRELLDRAGKAAQQLLPCFMMSPLSVAQFLKPGTLNFDLVIMDEASQLRPEDAIGAIARGRQVVVVGDPKQLPPTNFFMGADGAADEEVLTAADEQSILDQAMSILRPPRRLTWHYRSRHSSLIAFSNKEFYDNNLIVFPCPYDEHSDFGVRYIHVAEGRYRGSVNVREAEHVAKAALDYAREHPERSLGIVTLNQPQAEFVSEQIDRLAAQHEEFEAWRRCQDESLEPFFVKNLENVQGDERDVIFISTVYGRDQEGNFYQRFGPINNQGGHRRLNVLFTRAKYQTIVFSSMDPGEIRTDENSAWGVRALKGYLRFAKERLSSSPRETGRPPESDFEISVAEALTVGGYEAVPQVGVAGYFIDLGVRHPERPGEFVLGIECDGATYHSVKAVRDRDRLRQEVLERLKWRIYRIWSLDWYRNPKGATERLMKAVREAIAASG